MRARASGRPVLAADEVARRLVYTGLDRYRIAETMQQRLRDAPFTHQPDHAEQARRFDDELAALRAGGGQAVDAALERYRQALAAGPPVHWSLRERYAIILKRVGNAALAADEWRLIVRQLPQYPGFWLQLSRALRDGGRFAEARDALEKVLEFQPDAAVTLTELARLELAQGRSEEARRAARRAVAADPRDANALALLAAALCPRRECGPNERSQAIGLLRRALEAAPESEVVRRDLDALQHPAAP
jgi:tetratricopeptide (TPR) repeat protein